MKQIKNKLYKLDKEIIFLQDLENAHIEVTKNNNKKLINNIKKENENIIQKILIPILLISTLLFIITISNLALTSKLYDQYHIEECTCND